MFKKCTFSNIFGKKCTIFSNFEFKNAKKCTFLVYLGIVWFKNA